ncbi:MAG: DNRLRE domain-containing protein [Bacteroidetes bacterium]|nr:DNRLRE domain-containing protein [Bacteroidota bacterium]
MKRTTYLRVYTLASGKFIFILAALYFLGTQHGHAQVQFTPTDDCYIYASGPKAADPYGLIDPDTLKTRKSVSSDQFTRETYVKFNLGNLDTTYISAKVKLYGIVAEAKKVQVFYTDTAWSELTLTGNTRPPGTYINDLLLVAGEGYYSWDVTNYMNSALARGKKEIAFIFKDVAGAASTLDTRWHSKENASGNPPLLELIPGQPAIHRIGAYYVDDLLGNDNNSGASPQLALKSLEKIDSLYFEAGDSILFRSGGTWQGQLSFKGSGKTGKPIIVAKYGSGTNPRIEGMGLFQNTVQLTNQKYIEIQDLSISNLGTAVDFRRGIYIQGDDMGAVTHIFLRRLEVSDVNGSMDGDVSKNNGGIIFEITGSGTPTFFDTLVMENCYIHDVDRTGTAILSSWDTRTSTTDGDWTPSKNVIFRNNTFENTGANALIVRVSFRPLIEHNLFTHCSTKGSGNASFSFNTNYATWQYNEACLTVYNSGDEDAGGFDSDYNSKFTTIQYNFSHDNGYGALLVTGGPGNAFNDGTVIRYNVLANNGDHVIRTSGGATNTSIYNNTVYCRVGLSNISLAWHKSWEGYSSNTKYYNNIFQVMGPGANFDLGSSTGNLFDYNIFFSPSITNEPADAHKLSLNPLLIAPDSIGSLSDSISSYGIRKFSPAINSGMSVPGSPMFDIQGNAVPTYGIPDRGAIEYTGPTAIEENESLSKIDVHPNPAHDFLFINLKMLPKGETEIGFYSSEGRLCYIEKIENNTGEARINIAKAKLKPGIYILKVSSKDSVHLNTQVIID